MTTDPTTPARPTPTDIPTEMVAIEIAAPGGPEQLRPVTRPVPQPGPGEVLVKVAAAGVNRPDVLQRMGHYDPPPGVTDIPGLEIAGVVAAAGAGVEGVAVGDAVCALVGGGGYAEWCVATAVHCLPIPTGLDAVAAAGLPETVFTVWTNVFERARLQPGERFLVHGGSSGIGTTAIQMARAFGATVYATAGSAEKCRACEALGAARAINYRDEDFVEVLKAETERRGVDVILDMVGGDYVARNIAAMAPDGRHVSIAVLRGAKATVPMIPIMTKRLTLTGSTLRSRSAAEKAAIRDAVKDRVWPLIEAGTVRPVIDSRISLAEAARAHERMDSSQHVGKIILTVEG